MKKLYLLFSTVAALLSISFSAYAGQWQQDGDRWKYLNDDGTYSTQKWQWIDGNQDGYEECYFFGADGYLVTNTSVQGVQVNEDGAYLRGGSVYRRAVSTGSRENEVSDKDEYMSLEVGYNVRVPAGMYREHDHILDYYARTMARFEDAEGMRLIGVSVDDYRDEAEYFRTVEGTTDTSLQDSKADSVATTLKATVVARDTKEYHSGTWSHIQLTDYVGDYQKQWTNVHYFFQSEDFVLTSVRIWDAGVEMDIDGFMNSLVKNSYYASVR